jgi:HlyD family type I secretion membrane fusion protein
MKKAPKGGLRRQALSGLLVIVLGSAALAAWATLAPLAGAVIAPGFVKVDLNRKVVQHLEGGIVREIRVRDGDRVKSGQPLVVIEDVKVDAAIDQLKLQLLAERAKSARLVAEARYAPKPVFPGEVLSHAADAKVAETLERERALFAARRAAVEDQVTLLRRQIREIGEEVRALDAQIDAEGRALGLQREELKANEELLKKGYVQRTRVMTLERAVAEYEAKYGEHRAELAKARQRSSELDLRIVSAQNAYKQAAIDELKDSTTRIFDLQERLRPSLDAAQRVQQARVEAGRLRAGQLVAAHANARRVRRVAQQAALLAQRHDLASGTRGEVRR